MTNRNFYAGVLRHKKTLEQPYELDANFYEKKRRAPKQKKNKYKLIDREFYFYYTSNNEKEFLWPNCLLFYSKRKRVVCNNFRQFHIQIKGLISNIFCCKKFFFFWFSFFF